MIIGASAINQSSATGITLTNLFSNYPAEKVAQIYDDRIVPDSKYCMQYYRFSSLNISAVKIGKRLLHNFRSRRSRFIRTSVESNNVNLSNSIGNSTFGAWGDIFPFDIPPELSAWVECFDPDVIYSTLGSVRMMNLVLKLSEEFKLPVVPHFMDDWPTSEYSNSWLMFPYKFVMRAKLRSVLAKSSVALTISEDMAYEYQERYGGNFVDFMNCVDLGTPLPLGVEHRHRPIKFAYIGGLHLNRWKVLGDVVRALQLSMDSGYSVILEIYSPEADLNVYRSVYQSYSVVSHIGSLTQCEVSKTMSAVDVLIHVESFLPEDVARTRLSISTKIPQYMASGKPIFAYGPAWLSSIRYVQASGGGRVSSCREDILNLSRLANELIENETLRDVLGCKGRAVAEERHARTKVSAAFSNTLAGVLIEKNLEANRNQGFGKL